ncbi:flagellin [Peptoclostridium litorale DSM 5388]|uniref:Flagellin n=1 Tax=Peptoclostridium litorale DSM 5388 TaxID=1121324 RepID=A0A069REY4_PEPLI|nr:flagellin [Peptoclostridium litorale]KDR94760.1 flagellin [Peptoclostridium litorale DSM 5388]SIN92083.1 flagellin [Peptoclostridium litorale DSM 5388]
MIINHNMMAMNTHRQLGINANNGSKSIEKLSSGLRINRAGDDAAGLSISEKMRGQIRGLNQASRNAQDGISMIQTAEGALSETEAILQRMRELSVQSVNGTNTDEDRSAIQDEVSQLKSEIDRIGETTEFNTQKLLNGSLKSAGGAVVGQDTTTGSVVAKLTAGTITGAATMSAATSLPAAGDFVEETLTIDGTEIKVDWASLTTDEKAILTGPKTDAAAKNAAADLIEQKINEAIDASGKNVEHVDVYVDSAKKMVIESGSKGIDSKIDAGAAGIVKAMQDTYVSADGTSKYNGTTVGANSTAELTVDGTLLKFSSNAAITGGTTTMASGASVIQSSINQAISNYNTATGKTSGEEGYVEKVTVTASDDGRFVINSESGPVTLKDNAGSTTAADLGLDQAQTSAAGNGGMTYQIGANKGQTMTFGVDDMRSAALGVAGVNVSTAAQAENAITSIEKAISSVSKQRSSLGAVQNRLEHTIKNLDTSAENLQSSESRIRDVDMAKEMMNFSKNNILQQAAQSMLAQANQAPQGVLSLLR